MNKVKKTYKTKTINIIKLKSYLDKKPKKNERYNPSSSS